MKRHLGLMIALSIMLFGCQKSILEPQGAEIKAEIVGDNATTSSTVVLYGSSTIAQWPVVTNPFSPFQTVKLGVGGKTYAYFRANASIVQQYNPTKIVLYSGDNDILAGRKQFAIEADIMGTILKLEEENPGAVIDWLTIKHGKATWGRAWVISYINRNIGNWIKGTRVITGYPRPQRTRLLDITAPLLKTWFNGNASWESQLNPYYYQSHDMLHLKSAAYNEILIPQVKSDF